MMQSRQNLLISAQEYPLHRQVDQRLSVPIGLGTPRRLTASSHPDRRAFCRAIVSRLRAGIPGRLQLESVAISRLCPTELLRFLNDWPVSKTFVDVGLPGWNARSLHLLEIVLMDSLNGLPVIKLNAPTARRAFPDDDTLAVAVFGVSRSSVRAHSDSITGRERLFGFQQCVSFGTHAAPFPHLRRHAVKSPLPTTAAVGLALFRSFGP